MLGMHELWVEQYTPLLAEHKEIDTYVGLQGESVALPVANIPERGRISVLLGESGAGKTTSLWEIVVQFCKKLSENSTNSAPVLFNLRGWSPEKKCRELVQDQFKLLDVSREVIEQHLRNGSFLLLLDGFNEVLQENNVDCYYDVANFISTYRNNSYVITCRSSDFNSGLIPTRDIKPPLPDPDIYEICRLDRKQIIEYANTYFATYSTTPDEFLKHLQIENDDAWEDSTASVQLARIPLYLQIFLDVFRKTKSLPDGRVMLLKALVDRILDREGGRGQMCIDKLANEYLLGGLSFQSTESGYSLRFPENYAHAYISRILTTLKTIGYVANSITLGEVWRDILSANFLKSANDRSVEWLHQLIRDYFLGVEYARIWVENDEYQIQNFKQRLRSKIWDTASAIALGLLDEDAGSAFLWQLMCSGEENARRAFENQTENVRASLINKLVCKILYKGDYETKDLKTVSRVLPYPDVAEGLGSNFYSTDDNEMRALLIESIAGMIMEHYPQVNQQSYFYQSALDQARNQSREKAIHRCEELLRKYLKNDNELISFYAAKGLWEHDRSAAVSRLRELTFSENGKIKSMVQDLTEEWGIE